jgi:hypothetical protein
LIQRGGQRASSPCALESQQGVSQSWYPSVSQSVSYPVPTAIGYTQSTSRAGMRAGLGGCTQAPAAAASATPNTPWNTRPARASCSPGPWRLSGSRGCPLPLSETGKPGAGPGQWSWGEAISRLVFHAIDFMDRIIRGSSALARSQTSWILRPAIRLSHLQRRCAAHSLVMTTCSLPLRIARFRPGSDFLTK